MKEKYTSGEFALTEGQTEELISKTHDPYEKCLLMLAITSGIRRDDITKIKKKNIDFENNSLTFYQAKKKNFHTVYLPDKMIEMLRMISDLNKSTFLFPSKYGNLKKPISSKTAYNIFQRALERIKLPVPRPFHSLRATCIKLCEKRGWTAQETAKHVDDKRKTIEKYYLTPSPQERYETAKGKNIL